MRDNPQRSFSPLALGGGNAGRTTCSWDRNWRVKISEARYHRIITNGLTNALKFCNNGDIVISLSTDSSHIILEVRDHGIGIDEHSLPRLMQPFTKMDSNSPGAGLGLYITKGLVEKLGGDLTLRSAKGHGTTLVVHLPLTLLSPSTPGDLPVIRYLHGGPTHPTPASRSSISSSVPPTPKLDSPPIRVLVVDDNAVCRKILRMAFERSHTPTIIEEAENGQLALDKFTTFSPDIVMTDVSMPVMDGITSAGRMRELLSAAPPRICKIYALTGLGSSDPRAQSLGVNGKAALDGWLVKGKDMLDAVYKILDEYGVEMGTGRISRA